MYRVWHAEVNGGRFMGYFYYDLYKREGKNNQCIAFSLQKVCNGTLLSGNLG